MKQGNIKPDPKELLEYNNLDKPEIHLKKP